MSATPDQIAAIERDAYVDGDDGYLWLTCGLCATPLRQVDAGTAWPDMQQAVTTHACTEVAR